MNAPTPVPVELTAPVFVDTSVLILSEDGADPARRAQAMAWLRAIALKFVGLAPPARC